MGLKPTCKEVHRLTSEGLDRHLSVIEQLRVRIHLIVCESCTNFTAQMQLLRRAIRKFEIPADPPAPADKP
ncbi:putative anti-sigma-YlaC factor YlaD [Actimicrobium sp. GrIS 1.19]|uniref:zf-HC2 domain-containing protein n=1 Tax=Actimicrobium sp. GrIS 1.19 TaxID=3071708 RepID=UPI002E003686|nr:putative anti-sigma-YlaC factor YlaD [Actimicrobium sp. GrIS 1.19]